MPSAKQQPSNVKHGDAIRPNVWVLTFGPPCIISTGISRNALCSRVPEKLAGYKICAGYFSPNMEKTSPGFLEIPEYLRISGKRGVPNWERASWKIKHVNNEPSR